MTFGTAKNTRNKHNKRAKLWAAQEGLCWLCGGRMLRHGQEPDSATLDHVIPKARGGPNAIENLKLAHRYCNEERGREQANLARRRADPNSPWIKLAPLYEALNREGDKT